MFQNSWTYTSGLDPAEPYFQNTDRVVRLDPTDALFVDVIHTDAASFYSLDFGKIYVYFKIIQFD